MAWVATATIGANLVGGYLQKRSADKATKVQQKAAKDSTALQQQALDTQKAQYEATVERNAPFYQGGLKAYDALLARMGLAGDPSSPGFGSLGQRLTAEQVMAEPGYQFGLSEGQKAVDRAMGARGLRYSGPAIKAAARYANDYATGHYGNAFNRMRQMDQDIYGRMMDVTAAGQAAANNTTAAGTRLAGGTADFANAAGQNIWGSANAQAANAIGTGNIWANAINQGISAYQNRPQTNPFTTPNLFGTYQNPAGSTWDYRGTVLPDMLRGGGG